VATGWNTPRVSGVAVGPKGGLQYPCKGCGSLPKNSEQRGQRRYCRPCFDEVNKFRTDQDSRFWYFKSESILKNIYQRGRPKFAEPKELAARLRFLYDSQMGQCYYCQVPLDKRSEAGGASRPKNLLSIDHVLPGVDRLDNLVVCCWECNRKKQNNTLTDLKVFVAKIEEYLKNNLELKELEC
jgi:5-methylcytosine-specific restriction endonuclease McrA